MLDILQKSHHDQTGNHKLPTPAQGSNERAGGGGGNGGHRDLVGGGAGASATHRSVKDVRILYQVGVSILRHATSTNC